jgi:hypothetical protein
VTAHTHTEYVEGCYRCDLSRDEAAQIEAEERAARGAAIRREVSAALEERGEVL